MQSRGLLFIAIILLSIGSFASYDPTDDLLNAFSGSCSSVGAETSQSLQSSSALKAIAESLQNDPDCSGIASNLSALYDKQAQMAMLLGPRASGWAKNQSETRINELVSALAVENDSDFRRELEVELFTEQITRIDLGLEKKQLEKELLYNAAGDFLAFSQLTLSSLSKNAACIQKRPGIPLQVAGQILAVGSSLVSSPLGPSIFGLGNAVNDLAGYFLDSRYRKFMKKVSAIRLGPAMGCAIESLASNYCQARDTGILVKANANSNFKLLKSEGWQGLQILSRDIEQFNIWVQRVSSGSQPSNPAAADQKVDGNNVEAAFKNAISRMSSVLIFNREKEKTTPDLAKVNVRRGAINQLVQVTANYVSEASGGSSHSFGISPNSPFYDTFVYDIFCGPKHYFMTGKFEQSGIQTGSGRSCNEYTDAEIPQFNEIEDRVNVLIERASKDVSSRVALVKENDFHSVLAKYHITGGSLISPEEFLVKLKEYFSSISSIYGSTTPTYVLNLLDDTILRIEKTQAAILNEDGLTLEEVVTEIQLQLAPQQEQLFVFKRIQEIVQWDLIQKLDSGKLDENVKAILLDSLSNSLSLVEDVGLFGLEGLNRDAVNAQSLSVNNLYLFGDLFKRNITNYLKTLDAQHKKYADASLLENRAWFCMQVALLPNIQNLIKSKKSNIRKLCSGQVYKSVYSDSDLELNFDKISSQKFADRVCSVFDFNRKSRIFGVQNR